MIPMTRHVMRFDNLLFLFLFSIPRQRYDNSVKVQSFQEKNIIMARKDIKRPTGTVETGGAFDCQKVVYRL
jgi:hypothetical protein